MMIATASMLTLLGALAPGLIVGGGSPPAPCQPAPIPIVIAHRGASGLRPEHTLAAYQLAIEQGADYIEPDLVMTRDGTLVARHEGDISDTTDVAGRPDFSQRRRTTVVDGRTVSGWFAEDFTLAELRTLRARERLPRLRPASAAFDGRYPIPTLAEIIALVRRESGREGRAIGLYLELKHPAHHARIGLPMEAALVAQLHDGGYDKHEAPVFIQSFEVGALRTLRRLTPLRLVQLIGEDGGPADRPGIGPADMLDAAGLAVIATYADAVGLSKGLIVSRDERQRSREPTGVVDRAKAAGLAVHAWTFRSENAFLPTELRTSAAPAAHGAAEAEYRLFFCMGVDGVFTDFPADAVASRTRLGAGR